MSEMQRERDLVLNPNEYAYVLDKTKGLISCVVGSYKMSLSTSDSLVKFNEKTKRFEECTFDEAITTFVSAPENWYIQLKNPTEDGKHPTPGTSNQLPDLMIGKKINIKGNVSFALYPGQMARVIKGHTLKSNQYLLARVYDANVLDPDDPEAKRFMKTETVKEEGTDEKYTYSQEVTLNPEVGELFIIKGTETQFYMPPTGVEIVPVNYDGDRVYVRDAVTLERLEYCIIKDEKGNKKYIHGPAVVFPEPDEVFIADSNGNVKYRAIELSDISGIYVKVISDYIDKDSDKSYKTGDELFITGKEQKIYYPRAEHSIITYDGNIVHHAIAIPEGEGRYIMNRIDGDIKTVKGPAMYLPDPRTEVVVKRKLSRKQCELWYPGNNDVLAFNGHGLTYTIPSDCITCGNIVAGNRGDIGDQGPQGPAGLSCATTLYTGNDYRTLSYYNNTDGGITTSKAITYEGTGTPYRESDVTINPGFERHNHYTKPRTITIDNKYEGVVSVDIWTGYAVNVVSKTGDRKVVVGPQTYLMDYDESLEVLELSTGKPKTTDNLLSTVYLRVDNNKISDIIRVQTKDFVNVDIKVSYCVDFLSEYKNRWFSVENYVKYLTDRIRSLVKKEAKKYNIQDFYENSTDIVRNIALDIKYVDDTSEATESDKYEGRLFKENGMLLKDVEILSVHIKDSDIEYMINDHQNNIIEKTLKAVEAKNSLEIEKEIARLEKEKASVENDKNKYIEELKAELEQARLDNEAELNRKKEEEQKKTNEATRDLQTILTAIDNAEIARQKARSKMETDTEAERNKVLIDFKEKETENIVKILTAISPKLAIAMENRTNAELMDTVVQSISPYAIAEDKSVDDVVNKLLRGTSMEGLIKKISDNMDK